MLGEGNILDRVSGLGRSPEGAGGAGAQHVAGTGCESWTGPTPDGAAGLVRPCKGALARGAAGPGAHCTRLSSDVVRASAWQFVPIS